MHIGILLYKMCECIYIISYYDLRKIFFEVICMWQFFFTLYYNVLIWGMIIWCHRKSMTLDKSACHTGLKTTGHSDSHLYPMGIYYEAHLIISLGPYSTTLQKWNVYTKHIVSKCSSYSHFNVIGSCDGATYLSCHGNYLPDMVV